MRFGVYRPVRIKVWKERGKRTDSISLDDWWAQIEKWRSRNCLRYEQGDGKIKPQSEWGKLTPEVTEERFSA